MKRHRRDPEERAYHKGYLAGNSGKSRDSCPHTQESQRQEWLRGWSEGRTDQWDGYTGVAGLHRSMFH